jgi:two-component system, LytTR family, response regulator
VIRTLLIEDDLAARKIQHRMLAVHPTVQIVGETGTVRGARTLLARNNYDLVFMDIQLVGGNGFELMPYVRREARVIFLTMHNQHAVRAFGVNALDYLIKPVSASRLAESLGRVPRPISQGKPPIRPLFREADLVLLSTGKHQRMVAIHDILVIEAQENYSIVRLTDGSREWVRRTLKDWAQRLPEQSFVQVHRQTLVHLPLVIAWQQVGPKSFVLRMKGMATAIPVSRERWHAVRSRLPGA